MKRKLLYWLCSFVLIAGWSCSKSDDSKPEKPAVDESSTATQLVANWNLEEDIDLSKAEKAEAGKWAVGMNRMPLSLRSH